MSGRELVVSASPHLGSPESTSRIMWSVVASLAPVLAAAIWFFGPSALLVVLAASAGALLTERLWGRGGTLDDGSALITGLLLGLTLPASLPLWMAVVGGVVAIGLGKLAFGGLGQNVFNPALLGRAFLQAAFPVALTTYPAAGGSWWALRGDNLALPFSSPADVISEATPLGRWKFEAAGSELSDLVFGFTGGSLGETSSLLILLCGVWLALRKHLNWRIPVSVLLSVAVGSAAARWLGGERYPDPLFMLCSGGLMLGAVFMATDMVTSPTTNVGCWVFGAGIGALVLVIRLWGGLPEGVMYAILLMNALVPFINRATRPRVLGSRKPRVVR